MRNKVVWLLRTRSSTATTTTQQNTEGNKTWNVKKKKKEKQLDEKLFLIRFTDSTICNTQSGEGPKKTKSKLKPPKTARNNNRRELFAMLMHLCASNARPHLRWTEEVCVQKVVMCDARPLPIRRDWCGSIPNVVRSHRSFSLSLSRFIFIVSLSPIPPDPNYTSTHIQSSRPMRSPANATTRQLSQSYIGKNTKTVSISTNIFFSAVRPFVRSFNVSLVRTLVVTTHLHSDASHQNRKAKHAHTRWQRAVNRRHTTIKTYMKTEELLRMIWIPKWKWISLCRAHLCSFNTHKSSALSAQNGEQKKIMMMMKTEKETRDI